MEDAELNAAGSVWVVLICCNPVVLGVVVTVVGGGRTAVTWLKP